MMTEENLQKIIESIHSKDGWDVFGTILTVVSVASVAISAYAAWKAARASRESAKTQKEQIELQNKLGLLDKRIENYLLCRTFFRLVDENFQYLDIELSKDSWLSVNLESKLITNTDYFEKAPRAMDDTENDGLKYKFLQKMEDLDVIAEKSAILFPGRRGSYLKDFILSYRKVLRLMYRYQVLVDNMSNDKMNKMVMEAYSSGVRTLEKPKGQKELSKQYGENRHRQELLSAIDELKVAFRVLRDDNTLDKVRKKCLIR